MRPDGVGIDTASDESLVSRVRAGDHDARSELFRRYWPSAWRRAFAVTGRSALAEDVAQDAILTALDRLGDLERPAAFGAWLHQITSRRAVDAVRRESRLVSDEHTPEAEWIQSDPDRVPVQKAVAALPLERRLVIVMRYWLDLTPPEIAAATGVPVGTVHSRLGRALADLRRELGEGPG